MRHSHGGVAQQPWPAGELPMAADVGCSSLPLLPGSMGHVGSMAWCLCLAVPWGWAHGAARPLAPAPPLDLVGCAACLVDSCKAGCSLQGSSKASHNPEHSCHASLPGQQMGDGLVAAAGLMLGIPNARCGSMYTLCAYVAQCAAQDTYCAAGMQAKNSRYTICAAGMVCV